MYLEDYVKFSIERYPTLFASNNYDESEFKVLEHTFLCIGNGMEWAVGRSGKQLGYMGHRHSVKVRGEWRQSPNPPYGKVRYENGDTYSKFINTIYYGYSEGVCGKTTYVISTDDLPERFRKIWFMTKEEKIERLLSKDRDPAFVHKHDSTKPNATRERPYSVFGGGYLYRELLKQNLIQEDWRNAWIKHLLYWLGYYLEHPNPYTHVCKNPEDQLKHWRGLPIEKVRNDWRIPIWDGTNIEECLAYFRKRYKESAINDLNIALDFLMR